MDALKSKRGYTLVEILIAMVVLAIVTALTMSAVARFSEDEIADRTASQLLLLQAGLQQIGGQGGYPADADLQMAASGLIPTGLVFNTATRRFTIPYMSQTAFATLQQGDFGTYMLMVLQPQSITAEGYQAFCRRVVERLHPGIAGLRIGTTWLKADAMSPLPTTSTIQTACTQPGAWTIVLS